MAVALAGFAAISLPSFAVLGALVTTDRYIVSEDATITEDQYVTATSATIEGVVEGDLTLFTGSLTISGTVDGSVTVFASGPVTITETGTIAGSLNGVGTSLNVRGRVGSDVFFTAGSVVVEDGGSVERDVLAFGGTARIEGSVGRDVRGRVYRTTIDGEVARDVDLATQTLGIGPSAVVGGDVLYRSASDADIAEGATIVGTVTKLPAQGNFVYGIVLSLANIVGLLGFLVAGLVVLWVLRGTGARAVGAILTHPIKTLLAGIAAVVAVPLLVVILAITLVGIPIAIALGAACVVGFIVGAVPAVTALGNRVLINRGGLFGAFVVGALLWRLGIWIIPFAGAAIFLLGLVWGIGGWVLGALASRRAEPIVPALLPASITAASEPPPAWEPPLAPGRRPPSAAAVGSHPVDVAVGEVRAEGEDHGSPPPAPPVPAGSEPDEPASEESASATPAAEETASDSPPPAFDRGEAEEQGAPAAPDSLEERLRRFRAELDGTSAAAGDTTAADGVPSPDDGDRLGGRSATPPSDDSAGEDEGTTGDDGWGLPTR